MYHVRVQTVIEEDLTVEQKAAVLDIMVQAGCTLEVAVIELLAQGMDPLDKLKCVKVVRRLTGQRLLDCVRLVDGCQTTKTGVISTAYSVEQIKTGCLDYLTRY